MRNLYDNFIQQKPKEMSKTMEDMVFKYVNPETQKPTIVPAAHFEKELGREVERTIAQATNRQFLSIMFNQLNALKKEDEKYFYQALICMDNGLNPKDMRISDQIAMAYTYEFIQDKQRIEKKDFHFFNQDISNEFKIAKTDPNIQAEAMEISNFLENQEDRELKRIKECDEQDQNLNFEEKQNMSKNEENMDDFDMDIEDSMY